MLLIVLLLDLLVCRLDLLHLVIELLVDHVSCVLVVLFQSWHDFALAL